MDPATTATIIISVVGLLAGVMAHLRFRSKCHIGDILDISITKTEDEIKKEPDKTQNNKLSSLSNSDTEL